jgi:DNA-3-methyladenine glycosylase I
MGTDRYPEAVKKPVERVRCHWAGDDPLDIAYHDREWGVPAHDDRRFFEFLVLEGFQAGLSWRTILRKRPAFERAFAGFDPKRVAAFGRREKAALVKDAGIVRHRGKIEAAVGNARAFLTVQKECGSFDAYVWRFVGGRPRQSAFSSHQRVPAETEESRALSRDLRRRGFRFVGPTICYALMQATGLTNDHTTNCFRYGELARPARRKGGGARAASEKSRRRRP